MKKWSIVNVVLLVLCALVSSPVSAKDPAPKNDTNAKKGTAPKKDKQPKTHQKPEAPKKKEAAKKPEAKQPTKATPKPTARPAVKKPIAKTTKKAAAKKVLLKFVKITIHHARIWPVKPSGRCWDPCLGKRYKLPKRNKSNFMEYFKNKQFKIACSGNRFTRSKLPDPFVKIRIGNYETFTANKIDNTCIPNFNVSYTFRINPKDDFEVGVYDNDGAAGVRLKKDPIGIKVYKKLPDEIWNGGVMALGRFGHVENLILEAQVIKTVYETKTPRKSCNGVYRVRIVEAEVKTRKASGKTWDWKWAGSKPDLMVQLKIGPHTIRTQKVNNAFMAKFRKAEKTVAIKKGMLVGLAVYDKEPRGKEVIGQTASTDVCKIINHKGTYTFKNFAQVVKVVLIFEKK